ncbi:MAG: putative metallo-hydrolase YycJ [Chlamydiae bacterium]|nr:putative metallo-hydrolase YycJ [Chlamydiota bacterium]
MIGFCPLASGSKGNCIYFGTEHTKILIDAGISTKNIILRLQEIGVSIDEIDAILVSHEHSDHIMGLKVLSKRMNIPIMANSETAKGIAQYIKYIPKFKIFATGESFEFGDLKIHPFTIQHDTPDPVAFTIQTESHKIGFCTDLGFATTLVEQKLKGCDYLYLEANHTPSMVHASARPAIYKQRVLGRHGHLSNEDCASLVERIMDEKLKKIYLAHLSEECNSPEVALSTVKKAIRNSSVDVSIAHQHKISSPTYFSSLTTLA